MPVTFQGGTAVPTVGTAAYNAAASGTGSGSYNSSTGTLAVNGQTAYTPPPSSGTSSDVPPGWSPTAWATHQADMAKYFPDFQSSTQNPVSAGSVGNSSYPYLPPAPTATNVGGMVTANNAGLVNNALGLSLDANGRLVFNQPQPTDTTGKTSTSPSSDGFMNNLRSYLGLQAPPPNTSDIYNSLPEKTTFENAQQNVSNLTAQLNTITAKSQADQLSVTGQGRGVPEAIIGGQQAEIAKEAAINALPVQAQLAAAQGNLQLAQDHLDTVFKLRAADAQSQYEYQTKLVDSVFDFANKSEQRRLDDLKATTASNLSRVNNSLNFAQSLSANATKNGQVDIAAALTKLAPPDPSSNTFSQDLVKYNNQVAKLQGGITGDSANGSGLTGADRAASLEGDVQDVLTGRNTIGNIRLQMGRTKDASSYLTDMRTQIRKIDPKFDFVASDAGSKFVSSTYYQKAVSSINSVMPNIDKVVALSNDVNRLGVAAVDNQLQKVRVQLGDKKVANFREAQKLISDEIGLALGAGTVSDMKLQLGFDVTDPSVSPGVFASNMSIVKDFITNRKAGLEEQRYKSSTVTTDNPASSTITPSNTQVSGLTATGSWGSLTFPTLDALNKFKQDHNL